MTWLWDAPPVDIRPADEQRQVAYHEAAHSVVARYLGAPVEQVSIDPNRTTGGRTTITAAGAWLDDEIRAVIVAAGVVAEALAPGTPVSGECCADAAMLDEIDPEWAGTYGPVAVEAVNRLRPEIEAVAAALFERRTLDAVELDRLIAPSGSPDEVAGNIARWGWT